MPLSDLPPEMQQAFWDRLKELRMDPSQVLPKITPETHRGPVVFSSDPKESSVTPHLVVVNSLDEVKRLAGNADADYDSGLMQKHHPIQPTWDAAKNGHDVSELSAEENNRINAAEMAYIYGHSKHHLSYKEIIERHKYPAVFACFAAEDVCIDSTNSPFIVTAESGHNYGTITICEGGSIQFEANAVWTVQKMINSSAQSCAALGLSAKE